MLKKIIITLNEILFIIFLTTLFIIIILLNTLGNKNYVLSMLETNNYYNQIYEHSKSTLEGYTHQLGLDQEAIDSLYSKEKVKKDINILIDGIYDNKEMKIETVEITEQIENIILNKLKENNRTATSEEKIAIEDLKNTITEVYQNEILYSTKYSKTIQKLYSKIDQLRSKILISISIITTLIGIILIILNKSWKRKLTSISTSILASSFLLISIKLLLENKFQRILIFHSIFSNVIIEIMNNIMNIFFITGIIFSIISIIGIIIGVKNNRQRL